MVSKDIINKWNKKRGLIENFSYNNPISIAIYKNEKLVSEGLIRTYPIDTTIRYISSLYDMDDSQIEIFNDAGINKLRVIIPNNSDISNKIEKAMEFCGYFASVKQTYPYIDNWIYINFEPKNQSDVNLYIRGMKTLYHVTQENTLDKIRKTGLSPKFKNPLFTYPERIYLFVEHTPPDEIYQLAEQFKKIKDISDKYYLLEIDVNKIPEYVNFYLDPNYYNGVYTSDNIPPSAIVETYEILL